MARKIKELGQFPLGETFISAGFGTTYFLVLHAANVVPRQTAEVWVQAIN